MGEQGVDMRMRARMECERGHEGMWSKGEGMWVRSSVCGRK